MIFCYITAGILISLGVGTLLLQKNIIKLIVGINIIEAAIILLLITLGYKQGATAPIWDGNYASMVDPIPQALALTAIVIGSGTTALMLAFAIKLYNKYDTLNIDEINKLRG